MNNKQQLYFIAVIPPEAVSNEVTAIKNDFAERFQSKHALKVVPHITLKAPFKFPVEVHEKLLQWFQQMPVNVSSFMQELKNFGAFHNKRSPVIFIDPVLSDQLIELQKQIIQYFKQSFPFYPIMNNELKFHPHMTVAYRDLQPEMFERAWKEYEHKSFEAKFEVKDFYLLQHNGRQWNIIVKHELLK